MAGQLVTIATFDQAAQAHVAKNVLEAAGIPAAISDEETVSMLWSVSTAVGGVKIKVLAEDADRALAVLDKELGPEDSTVDPEEFAAEAEAAAPEEGAEPITAPEPSPAAPPADARDGTPSARDEYARRVFFTAWLGVFLLPVALFALYLFLRAACGSGPLSARGRFNLFVGGAVMAPAVAISSTTCAGMFGAFR
jgi:hypothetical protein